MKSDKEKPIKRQCFDYLKIEAKTGAEEINLAATLFSAEEKTTRQNLRDLMSTKETSVS